jgi:replication factor C subunit 3/5
LPEKEVEKKVDQVIEKEGYVDTYFPNHGASALMRSRCNLTEDGKAALLKLSRGDMRRALNVLQVRSYPRATGPRADGQACHAAYDVIDETAVYNCTGNPHPKDIERVVQSMMSDEFGTSYSRKCIPSQASFTLSRLSDG